ncbi:unnamed protein product [Rotaria sp. Silwood2]|nr:unnamed protein product [Rotaria sp. Silwood2]CAF3055551.1 unnamed protein product [Rotaria sp. Silwood2]CAF3336870.1 unnamed protein product [Rotaria sp. Silwood2]CAF3384896.1 unnamed protein product [Rotaria sp. Silwood2]CAF4270724.1 unnamed protein product [Rotaria sp. Silwood2]
MECHFLSSLNRLNFIDCYFRTEYETIIHALNDIWRLTYLTHCHMDISLFNRSLIIVPFIISTTLQSLSIESYSYSLNQLTNLLKHSPLLRYLSILINDNTSNQPSTFSLQYLTTLQLFENGSQSTMMNLLRNSANLRLLIVKTDQIKMNGYDWQTIIVDHLPDLQVFKLMMIFRLNNNDNKKQHADNLLNSFRTSFWLEKHQWFVRCEWNRCEECDNNNLYLYTLPYAFEDYFIHDMKFCSKSTCRYDDDVSSYDRVQRLSLATSPLIGDILPCFRFSQLHYIDLDFPFDTNLFAIITKFNRLVSIRITDYNTKHVSFTSSQFQDLLDRMPHLTSLQFNE